MSRHRSGLLSGLIVGLFMALLCAAGWAAFAFYADRLPDVVRSYGDGIPLAAGLALATGLLVGAAICLIRPRSLVLAPLAALYGAGAVMAGVIAGIAAFPEYLAHTPAPEPWTPPLPTLDAFLAALPGAAEAFWPQVYQSWQLPAVTAAAALAAFALVLVRTLRLRKKAREAAATEEPQEEEPEYRAPFEPLQAAKPATAPPPPSLFTPPDRDAT
ncbi:hypothetical protein [Nonomuraea sp. SBT364]|uniref:hypothetical protein n=1 Tax=Nonomuraea sp. SBT364 TaxID=1580530 RepID=UPI00066AAAA4|nr:hypothetical protein [Nonomuraea sp. SBT364]